ncbi:unnamed protein product [Urochloa humidicola]
MQQQTNTAEQQQQTNTAQQAKAYPIFDQSLVASSPRRPLSSSALSHFDHHAFIFFSSYRQARSALPHPRLLASAPAGETRPVEGARPAGGVHLLEELSPTENLARSAELQPDLPALCPRLQRHPDPIAQVCNRVLLAGFLAAALHHLQQRTSLESPDTVCLVDINMQAQTSSVPIADDVLG